MAAADNAHFNAFENDATAFQMLDISFQNKRSNRQVPLFRSHLRSICFQLCLQHPVLSPNRVL